MKQILFEKGKLYVVELPEKPTVCHNKCSKLQECSCDWLTVVYENRRDAALANKAEVKNPELLPFIMVITTGFKSDNVDFGKQLADGETFSIPADLTFDKETGMLKRIEPEKSIARRIYDETSQEVKDKVRAYGHEVVNKSVEPEKKHKRVFDGMTHEEIFEWLDKRCMFSDHQKDYVHMVLIKLCSK